MSTSIAYTLHILIKQWPNFLSGGRSALDVEILKYVGEAYPKGVCSVYCTKGKEVEGPGLNFELVVVISACRLSPQNFWCVNLSNHLELLGCFFFFNAVQLMRTRTGFFSVCFYFLLTDNVSVT